MNFQLKGQYLPPKEKAKLKAEFSRELSNILNWWQQNMLDEQNGGFYGQIDGHGQLHPQADKGCILNTRMLWTFAAAANALAHKPYRRLAERAYQYITRFFWDELEGGVIWSVNYEGHLSNTQKQIYAQAFAIYALVEFYQLTGMDKVLQQASEIYWLIEKYSFDRKKNGYLTAFDRSWGAMDDIRLSEKDANEAKIMNTHLHLLEAYTNFYKVIPSAALESSLRNLIQLFLDHFYNPVTGSLHIYFNDDWEPKGENISFGHDIEASWLLWESAEVLKDNLLLKKVQRISIQMAEAVLENAVDEDGAIFYEADPQGIKDSDKHWWPQAEAVVGFFNAWQLSGERKFLDAAIASWSFIKNHLMDAEKGEWFWRTDRNRNPILSEDKAGPWKAPYHNSRMCLEMLKRLNTIR